MHHLPYIANDTTSPIASGEIAQLADFGLADYVQEESECVVATQGEVGTPYYTAPEMINNQPVSYKSDMWSLGR